DHLVYAVPDLENAIDDLESRIGVRAVLGGRHLEQGTRNALIALGLDSYLEILAPDPSQPAPDRPLWLGLEGLAEPRLTGWAIKASKLEDARDRARASGVRLGPVVAGNRRRPDGTLLSWEFTDPHVLVAEGLVPFLIDWGGSRHPAASAPGGVSLLALRAEHPHPAGVRALLGGIDVKLPVTKGGRAALIANLKTPRGGIE